MRILNYQDAVQSAIAFEQMGIDFYKNYAKVFSSNSKLRDLLMDFADDEIFQRWQLTSMLQFMKEERPLLVEDDDAEKLMVMNPDDFKDCVAGGSLSGQEVLNKSILFEKEAMAGLKAIENIFGVEPELEQMIEIEENHIKRLNQVMGEMV
ncbi:MAG: hypothetical protein OEY59_09800 [Deltaproteobacteria bacterium]|nr:hypothetical protein [Deltaproteobacteria bacterium]